MTARRIDFAMRPGHLPWRGWLLLLLGATALAAALALNQHWRDQAQAVRRSLDQSDREAARRQAADRARLVATPVELRRRAQLLRQQAWPWQQALQAVDAAVAEPVYLLGMNLQPDTDTGAGQLKLEAQAPSWSEALAFVEKLRQAQARTAAPQALGPPQLSTQQQALDAGTNAPVVRFVVTVPIHGAPPDGRARP